MPTNPTGPGRERRKTGAGIAFLTWFSRGSFVGSYVRPRRCAGPPRTPPNIPKPRSRPRGVPLPDVFPSPEHPAAGPQPAAGAPPPSRPLHHLQPLLRKERHDVGTDPVCEAAPSGPTGPPHGGCAQRRRSPESQRLHGRERGDDHHHGHDRQGDHDQAPRRPAPPRRRHLDLDRRRHQLRAPTGRQPPLRRSTSTPRTRRAMQADATVPRHGLDRGRHGRRRSCRPRRDRRANDSTTSSADGAASSRRARSAG